MSLSKFLAPSLAFSIFNFMPSIEQSSFTQFINTDQQNTLISENKPDKGKEQSGFKISIQDKPFPFSKRNFVKKLSGNIEIGFSKVNQESSISFGLVNNKIAGVIGEGKNPSLNPALSIEGTKVVYKQIEAIISSNPVSKNYNIKEPTITISQDLEGKYIAIFEISSLEPDDVFRRLRLKLTDL
jgi:hypothetical protein